MAIAKFSKSTANNGFARYTTLLDNAIAYPWVISATGGTITTANGYKIHTFTTTGNSTFTPSNSGVVEVLIVGAGGGTSLTSTPYTGGWGGGGGGGGVVYHPRMYLNAQAYTVTVGAGSSNANGENSSFNSHIAYGGGKGGVYNGNQIPPNSGASGGGAGGDIEGLGGEAIFGQGYRGGTSLDPTPESGGGGGGAGEQGYKGFTGTNANLEYGGGRGGNGIELSISGTSTYYGGGGGGGGGVRISRAPGGAGGGGRGGDGYSGGGGSVAGLKGTDNTGGGAGGGINSALAGGHGIVIVRYPVYGS